mgnify:CR=1 FL=1|tara:strand:+ start:2759 stop:3742 length:984 start_codon:yes stop_codon:yes gene_type:complete
MIIKFFELDEKRISKIKIFLLYGLNQGLKEEIISKNFRNKNLGEIYNYSENQILNNKDFFFDEILTNSFFETKKIVIIKKVTDKILDIIENLRERKIDDIKIILIADLLDTKSKIRKFFEKNNDIACIPFYEDTNITLAKLAQNFFRENKVNISQQSINLLVERSRGDRMNLNNELNKIKYYAVNKKTIELNEVLKLSNLSENYSASELVDNSLAKNKRKTLSILNENNFLQEDCVMILRIFLSKLKRLLKIKREMKNSSNIEKALLAYKPPIFWKEKDIIKSQIEILDYKKILDLIIETNKIELLVKKNPSISVNLTTNFILEKSS